MLAVLVEVDRETPPERIYVPRMVLAWPVARVVGRGDIGDGFGINPDNLEKCVRRSFLYLLEVIISYLPSVKLLLAGCYARHLDCAWWGGLAV